MFTSNFIQGNSFGPNYVGDDSAFFWFVLTYVVIVYCRVSQIDLFLKADTACIVQFAAKRLIELGSRIYERFDIEANKQVQKIIEQEFKQRIDGDEFLIALYTSASNANTQEDATVLGSISNQVANGNGYVTGGLTLSGLTWQSGASSGVIRWDFTDPVWSASGGIINLDTGAFESVEPVVQQVAPAVEEEEFGIRLPFTTPVPELPEFITGEDRETRATRELPELGKGGLLSGEDVGKRGD